VAELTRQLAAHVARVRYADLPAAAVLAAKRSLLDAIGVSLGASGLEPACAPFAELAAETSGPCTVLGVQRRSSPLMAALANGALAHALDYEDAYDGAPVHPNAASVPVALALAERSPTISGQQLVAALAVGCDLVCRLGLSLQENPDRYGFFTPPILSAFGAAATAAQLLGLDEERVVATFALTLSQAMCSSQWKTDPDSSLRAIRDAFPAQTGLLAALLANQGVRGFEGAFEGTFGLYALYARGAYDPAALLDQLGTRFLGEDVSFKPWPSCRGTHAFVSAALELKARHGVDCDAIDSIEARGAALNTMLMEPLAQKQRPATAIDAKFSLPFCLGSALARGTLSLDDFAPAALTDPRVLALAQRVRFTAEPGTGMRDAVSGELTVQLRSGARHALRVEHPLGHPRHPLAQEQLIAKFVDCAGRAASPISEADARLAAHAILTIDEAARAQHALRFIAAPPQPTRQR
jgi:2-methylcitrate dehydratase PrpD